MFQIGAIFGGLGAIGIVIEIIAMMSQQPTVKAALSGVRIRIFAMGCWIISAIAFAIAFTLDSYGIDDAAFTLLLIGVILVFLVSDLWMSWKSMGLLKSFTEISPEAGETILAEFEIQNREQSLRSSILELSFAIKAEQADGNNPEIIALLKARQAELRAESDGYKSV